DALNNDFSLNKAADKLHCHGFSFGGDDLRFNRITYRHSRIFLRSTKNILIFYTPPPGVPNTLYPSCPGLEQRDSTAYQTFRTFLISPTRHLDLVIPSPTERSNQIPSPYHDISSTKFNEYLVLLPLRVSISSQFQDKTSINPKLISSLDGQTGGSEEIESEKEVQYLAAIAVEQTQTLRLTEKESDLDDFNVSIRSYILLTARQATVKDRAERENFLEELQRRVVQVSIIQSERVQICVAGVLNIMESYSREWQGRWAGSEDESTLLRRILLDNSQLNSLPSGTVHGFPRSSTLS
ncbi:hypothetical protein N7539_009331, partial [Penicillium diatomitis]